MKDYNEMIDFIKSLSNLKDGWMGRGSVAPTPKVVENAEKLLASLQNEELDKGYISIEPSGNGTVLFDFETPDKIISVEIGETKLSYFTEKDGKYFEVDNLKIDDPKTIEEVKELILGINAG